MTCEMQTNVQAGNKYCKQGIDNLETDGWGLMACLREQVQLPLQKEGWILLRKLKTWVKLSPRHSKVQQENDLQNNWNQLHWVENFKTKPVKKD